MDEILGCEEAKQAIKDAMVRPSEALPCSTALVQSPSAASTAWWSSALADCEALVHLMQFIFQPV